MPTMTIPSANMRRLKRLAAEAAARSSSGGSPRTNIPRGRSPPRVPRREERAVAMPAPADACDDSEARAAGAGANSRRDAGRGARVLVRAPLAASAATAAQPALVRAVVVSAADEDGYLEVVYEGAPLPGDDPFATVRVARDQVIAVADTPLPASGGGTGRDDASSPPGAETKDLKMLATAAADI